MDALHDLITEITDWLMALSEPTSWGQIAVLGLAALLARGVDAWLDGLVLEPDDDTGLRRLALRTAQRIVFPISMLIGVLIGRAALQRTDLPSDLLNVAVPLLLSLAAIRTGIYLLRKSFAPSPALKAWESVIGTSVWSLAALHFLGWLEPLSETLDSLAFEVGAVRISVLSASKMLLMLALLMTLALWVSALLERKLKNATHLSPAVQVGLAKFIKFFLLAAAVLGGLNAVGIDLTALTVFGGALGVGLGFGLQRIASNFVSGFIVVMDRSIRPGDMITVGQNFGQVQELRARYVVVRNRDGVETLIPNESLITSEVTNWTYSDRRVRVRVPVQISYNDDPEQAMALMLKAAHSEPRVLADPEPAVSFMEFGDNGLLLELGVWIDDPEDGLGGVRSTINLEIWRLFKAAGISFPYPQRDLYIKELPALPGVSAKDERAA